MSFFIVKIEKKIYVPSIQYSFIHWIKFQRKNNIWILYSSYSNKDQLRNIFLKKKFNKVLTWVKSRKIDFFNQKFDDSKLFSYKAKLQVFLLDWSWHILRAESLHRPPSTADKWAINKTFMFFVQFWWNLVKL